MIYSFSGGQTTEEYIAEIEEEREEQDIFMRNSSESPFYKKTDTYNGLKHYPIDIKYKINAKFIEPPAKNIRKLPTNDDSFREYLEYGYAEFTLFDKKQSLLILENVEDEKLFLAFGDETSAETTYGAGRYLDVTHSGGNSITLDFNLAYNPYCAYSDEFSCPLPPRENLLSVPIEAGEKTYN
ncbi:DUF1684 domain-containing protein [Fulvivirga lutea]|uniref:DUF1684 domain-containing protein n=1 Tax=Fulvivirga lutea TaxID=2810512 RepID=A0A974WHS5_9BACT|nr:DUF1684 domain-containing protein [Fulvivirga lutea]QSE97397.1 DUF1684 domain-containing protein [Fulvivirga lutea]